jgi:hypothetical protein
LGHGNGEANAVSYVWEEDIDIFVSDVSKARPTWHLKQVIPETLDQAPPWRLGMGRYKVSHAWVSREGERKYEVRFVRTHFEYNKTFRSLKAAKAYALAIVSLTT